MADRDIIDESIPMTQKAKDNNDRSINGIKGIFSDEPIDRLLSPVDYLNQAAMTPNSSLQNIYLFLNDVSAKFDGKQTGIPITYTGAETNLEDPIAENEKGSAAITKQVDEYGNIVKLRAGTRFDLIQTRHKGENYPRRLPDMERFKNHDVPGYKQLMDALAVTLNYHDDSPVSKTIATYVFMKHFNLNASDIDDERITGNLPKSRHEMNQFLIDNMKDMKWNEMSAVLNNALNDASDAITTLRDTMEAQLEQNDNFREAEIFGTKVICSTDSEMRVNNTEPPIGMFPYEIYSKEGKDYVAKETPEDGTFKNYIVSANALPDMDKEGLRLNTKMKVIGNHPIDIKSFKEKCKDMPISEISFYLNDKILANNEKVLTQTQDDHFRAYGIYSNGKLVGGGYIDRANVPKTNAEFLSFAEKFGVSVFPNRPDHILFNCDSGLNEGEKGQFTLIEVKNASRSTSMTRTASTQTKLCTVAVTREFLKEHGAPEHARIRNPRANVQEVSQDSKDTKQNAKVSDDMPKKEPSKKKTSTRDKIKTGQDKIPGGAPYGPQSIDLPPHTS